MNIVMDLKRAQRYLRLGVIGAVLTLIGDLLIGCVKFPDGADLIEGYLAAALILPAWRPVLGGFLGFLGISLECFGLMTVYPLLKLKMPRGAAFYKLSVFVYLAVAGGAVHLPCGVLLWLYRSVSAAAGQQAAFELALQYVLYFLLPVAALFFVFFFGSSIVQFIAIAKGATPLPRWYCVFNLVIFMGVFNSIRRVGNYAIVNGIGTSNKSLGALVMFLALMVGFRKYVTDQDLAAGTG